jgi:hypothetical protein
MSPPSSGSKNKPSKNHRESSWQADLSRWFVLGIFFDPEDGRDMFFRNAG